MAEVSFEAIASVYNVTVSTTALTLSSLGFTAGQIAEGPDRARVTVETADVKMTDDGSTPTATSGHTLPAGFDGMFQGNRLVTELRFIRRTSTDAKINVTLYRRV